MENNKQVQKAGENSKQFQAEKITINNGITEERTRAIFSEMFNKSREDYTKEAYQIANARVELFESSLIPRIAKIEGASEAFSDPKFQFLLRDAQKVAASTERKKDYDLLTELLLCHIQKGENRKTRASIGLAIDIVDNIDNDALCALTVANVVDTYLPITGICSDGLKVLNELFSKLMYEELPVDNTWLDHLDILGAIRMTLLGSMDKIPDIYIKSLNGYACIGIKIGSEEHKKAIEILNGIKLPQQVLVANELMYGYIKLPVVNKDAIKDLSIINNIKNRMVNGIEIIAFNEIWDLYSKDSNLFQEVNSKFIELWDSFESLKKLRIWWNSIPSAFSVTQVGVTLAHTNAKRCYPSIPASI